jgi:citrate synthase
MAFLVDQGFTPQEIYRIFSISVNSGVTACYIEAAESSPESFLPLRCCDMDYQGHPPRELP